MKSIKPTCVGWTARDSSGTESTPGRPPSPSRVTRVCWSNNSVGLISSSGLPSPLVSSVLWISWSSGRTGTLSRLPFVVALNSSWRSELRARFNRSANRSSGPISTWYGMASRSSGVASPRDNCNSLWDTSAYTSADSRLYGLPSVRWVTSGSSSVLCNDSSSSFTLPS